MTETSQTKTFFAPTKERAQQDARKWADEQKDVYIPMSNSLRKSESGGWF